MLQTVSKSKFKAQALELLRIVEKQNQPLVITHGGKPVVKVVPYQKEDVLKKLHGTLIFYKEPNKPVGERDWEVLK